MPPSITTGWTGDSTDLGLAHAARSGQSPATVGPEFRLLGPLAVVSHGRPVPLQGGKQRALLAVLLLNRGRTVRIRELTDRIWDGVVPSDPRGTIQKYVMRLRRTLAATDAVISTEPDGYRIDVAPGHVDVQVFDDLVERATDAAAAGTLQAAIADLEDALQLWREVPPLADVASEAVQRDDAPRLVERYLRAVEMRVDIGLQLGRHAELCGELLELVNRYPLRERFWAQRMSALYGANRQADALEAYRTVSRLLADELGIDPGADLRRVHQQILGGTSQERVTTRTSNVVPYVRQLPMPTAGMVGRAGEIEEIVRTLSAEPGERRHPLVLLTGPAGVGKTALTVAAAHRLAHHYPDGQLFAALRNHPPTPACQLDVLGYFLRALGTPSRALPTRLEDAIAAFRTMTADRRLLVVLDGVADGSAARALLPGGATSGVLVTGRAGLTSLLVSPGGRHVALDVLPPHDALELLAAVMGEDRVCAEHQAARRVVALCDGSPLALRTAAADLATAPGLSIRTYVRELEASGRGEQRARAPETPVGGLRRTAPAVPCPGDWQRTGSGT